MTRQTTLPSITRWVVILAIGIFILAMGALLVLAGVILFAWPYVVAEVGKDMTVSHGVDLDSLQGAALGICSIGIAIFAATAWALNQLRKIVDTVRDGDPFVAANAARLRKIGWVLVGIQLTGIPIGILAVQLNHHFDDIDIDTGFPLNGLLAILLVFVLARVFEQGAAMREDLEGTV